MVQKRLFFCLILVSLLFLSNGGVAYGEEFTSSSYKVLDHPVINPGGYASSTDFKLFGTIGEVSIGPSTSSSFGDNSGFLYFPEVTSTSGGGSGISGGGGLEAGSVYINGCRIADFNCDKHVNIFDLSILLYYIEQTGPAISLYDLSKNNRVGFTDISIVFYYWDVV